MIRSCLAVLLYLVLAVINPVFSLDLPQKQVTILQMVEHPALNSTRQGIIDELKENNINITYQSAQGNAQLAIQIANHFVNLSPNCLVGLGTTATQALVAANQTAEIPIVFSSVTDPIAAQLVQNLKNPSGNITGVSNYLDPTVQFTFLKKMLPSLKRLGILYNPGEANSVVLLEKMQQAAKKMGLELVVAPINQTAEVVNATQSLLFKIDAIFINNDNTALSAFDAIINATRHYNLPVFCSDIDMLNRGALAAIGPDQYQIGRKTGKMILQILNSKKPQDIPVLFADVFQTKINYPEAMRLNIDVPKEFLQ